jgi:hypothetical protein
MQAGDVRLGQVFANHQQNVIPLFQRPYVWSQERNWEPLWQDVRLAAEEVEREGSSAVAAGSERTYFLGAVVLQQRKVNPKRLSSWYVIDGQQRLTTLQVLLSACRQTAADLGESSLAAKFTSLIENQPDIVHPDHPEDKYKVWPLPQDREVFLWTVERSDNSRPSPDPDHKLTHARTWFGQTVSEWAAEAGDPGLRLGYLYETVYERMQLVKIALEQNDDPQVIFEVLNHRGVPLDAADLIKNLLFQVLAEHGQDKLADSLLMESWLPLDRSYWRSDVTIGRLYRKRIDLLLSYWLTIETAEEVSVEHLFSDFKTWLRKSERDIPAIIKSVRHFADTMQAMRNLPPDDPMAQLIDRMDATQTSTPWPLILYLSANETIPQSSRHKAARAIDSFLMRRGVCRMTTKNYNKLFVQVLAMAKQAEPSDVGGSVEQALLQQTAESSFWPTDDMFLEALKDSGLYLNLVRRQLTSLLVGIENHLQTEKTEDVKLLKSGDGKLNVEHLLPQTWQKTWPLAVAPDDEDYPESLRRRERSLHQLGNLTLTTVKLNPSLSNKPWTEKRPEIQKHSLLRLTTGSVLTAPRPESGLSDQEWSSEWDEERIRVRGEHLAQEAIRVWPRPPSESATLDFSSGEGGESKNRASEHPRNALTLDFDGSVTSPGRERVGSGRLTDRRKGEIAQILLDLIRSTTEVIEDDHAGSYIRFLPPLFDQPWLKGARWTESGRMLLFEFQIHRDGLGLVLLVGPGDKEKRRILFDMADTNPTGLIRLPIGGPGTRWGRIYWKDFGRADLLNRLSDEELVETLREQWAAFIHDDMPDIVEALRKPITEKLAKIY